MLRLNRRPAIVLTVLANLIGSTASSPLLAHNATPHTPPSQMILEVARLMDNVGQITRETDPNRVRNDCGFAQNFLDRLSEIMKKSRELAVHYGEHVPIEREEVLEGLRQFEDDFGYLIRHIRKDCPSVIVR